MCLHGERRAELLCLTATDHSVSAFAVQVLGLLKKNRKCIFTKLYKKKDGEQKLVFSTGLKVNMLCYITTDLSCFV